MTPAQQLIAALIEKCGPSLHRTKLVKLVYFVDYLYYQHYGRTYTGFEYWWDNYGPNAGGNAIVRDADALADLGMVTVTQGKSSHGGPNFTYRLAPGAKVPEAAPDAAMLIRDVAERYGRSTIAGIVRASKETKAFENAQQHRPLRMTLQRRAESTTKEDLEAYLRDLEEQGAMSLDQVRHECGLA
jgi:hypothetical protein